MKQVSHINAFDLIHLQEIYSVTTSERKKHASLLHSRDQTCSDIFFIRNCTSSDVFFLPNSPSLSRLCRFYLTNPDSQSGIPFKGSVPFKRAKNHLIGAVGHERITSKGKNRKVKTPSHGSTISCHVGNGW